MRKSGSQRQPLSILVTWSKTAAVVVPEYCGYRGSISRRLAPARRWAYGVNERIWSEPESKPVDVAYHVARTKEREHLALWLGDFMADHPEFRYSHHFSLDMPAYIQSIRQAKLVVHIPTWPQCRTHRIFDALAAGSCLLSSELPNITGDGFIPGQPFSSRCKVNKNRIVNRGDTITRRTT